MSRHVASHTVALGPTQLDAADQTPGQALDALEAIGREMLKTAASPTQRLDTLKVLRDIAVARANYQQRNPPASAVVDLFALPVWLDFKRVLDAVLLAFDVLYAPPWPEEHRLGVSLSNALDMYNARGLPATLEAIRRRDLVRAPDITGALYRRPDSSG
jgi:hypothetical protein